MSDPERTNQTILKRLHAALLDRVARMISTPGFRGGLTIELDAKDGRLGAPKVTLKEFLDQ
jgi:hypothetical protein